MYKILDIVDGNIVYTYLGAESLPQADSIRILFEDLDKEDEEKGIHHIYVIEEYNDK